MSETLQFLKQIKGYCCMLIFFLFIFSAMINFHLCCKCPLVVVHEQCMLLIT
jgi:hypothetical protein